MDSSFNIESFFAEFALYAFEWSNNVGDWRNYLLLIAVVSSLWLLTIVFSKFLFRNKQNYPHLRVFYIRAASIIAASIVSAFVVGYISFLWSSGSYDVDSRYRFIHIIMLVLSLVVAIVSLLALRRDITRSGLRQVAVRPKTLAQETAKLTALKRSFRRLKWWILCPALGLTGLLAFNRPYSLVSIVLDNSGSMSEGQLEKGRNVLLESLEKLVPQYVDFVITVFAEKSPSPCGTEIDNSNERLSGLLSKTKSSQFCTTTIVTEGEVPLDYIQNIHSIPSVGLHQGILQNMIECRDLIDNNALKYSNKAFLVISDCEEAEASYYDVSICDSRIGIEDVFDSEAYLIDIRTPAQRSPGNDLERYQTFLAQFDACFPGNTYDGFDTDDYAFALDNTLGYLARRSWYIIVWICVLYLLAILSVALINPKRSRL